MMQTEKQIDNRKILVVDDDAGLCDLIARALEREGHIVCKACCGREAVELAASATPALMLLDYRLPDMTAPELAAALAELGLEAPFVMMTGQGDERLAVELMKLGAADYLVKDTALIDRLPAVVERALREAEVKARLLEAEEALRRAAKVFDSSSQGILITDRDGLILDVNPAFTAITGYSREEALGRTPRFLHSGRQPAEFYAALRHELLTTGRWQGELWNRGKDGREFAEQLTINAVVDEGGRLQNYIGLFSDITALKEYQARLERNAFYDELTGLPNRLLLADRLRKAMSQVARRSRCLAVVFLDMDGFKAVNDSHSHETGDRLLEALGRRLAQVLRDSDTLARFGGDEFVAVLVDLPDLDACVPVLDRLLAEASRPVVLGELELRLSVSLGVVGYPQREEVDADQLLRQADQAMYQAKQSGKNRYQFFDAIQGNPDLRDPQSRDSFARLPAGTDLSMPSGSSGCS